jgi:DNA-binding transcriptional LysR family regulator
MLIRGTCVAVSATVQAPFLLTPPGMNHLRFLKYFEEVARAGSIRQAAESLHVAPSAVNRRIQDLEDELGVLLFERLPRGMRLTTAGELFVQYVRGRASALDEVRSQIEELQGLRRGSVRVVASQALAPQFMPRLVAEFRKTHPLVSFQVRIGDHVQALQAMRAFETDVALVFNLAHELDIEFLAEAEQRLVAIMHRSHPLAGRPGGLRLRDCVDYPLALPTRDTGGRQMLERYLERSSVKLRPAVECNSFEFLRGYLRHEDAISFQIAVGAVGESGDLVALEITDRHFPSGSLVLAHLRGRQLPIAAHAFIAKATVAMGNLGLAPQDAELVDELQEY